MRRLWWGLEGSQVQELLSPWTWGVPPSGHADEFFTFLMAAMCSACQKLPEPCSLDLFWRLRWLCITEAWMIMWKCNWTQRIGSKSNKTCLFRFFLACLCSVLFPRICSRTLSGVRSYDPQSDENLALGKWKEDKRKSERNIVLLNPKAPPTL